MAFLDRILGKKSAKGGPASGGEKKPEKKNKKPVAVKTEKKKDGPIKRAKTEKPKKTKAKTEKAAKAVKKEENIAYSVLIEPFVTEKSTSLGQFNKYVFKVDQNAGKRQIRKAVQDYYGVRVTGVNIIKIHPKKRIHGRTIGYKQGYKKAIVTLQQGDTIGINESV
jgi:large subunit ribosomal protein L23